MTKKLETVKEEDLIQRKDGLYYTENANVPFTGVGEIFHDNGQLMAKINYKNGQLHGPEEWFEEDGNLGCGTGAAKL